MEEKINAYRVLMEKLKGKKPLGRPRRRWVDDIKMDLRKIGCGSMDCIDLAQEKDERQDLMNRAMHLRIP
jgi:hypothetical protein